MTATRRKMWKFKTADIAGVTGYADRKIRDDIRKDILDPSSLLSLWRYITKARVQDL